MKKAGLKALPKGVWVLGAGSFFMDASSEAIHSLLPVFLVSVLGASVVSVGLIEGVAEGAAALMRVFSGYLSDVFRNRKWLTVSGYALSALTKPLFPLATSVGAVFAARFFDRVGKGIRGAPRDALVGDIAPKSLRGAAYGLRQALDSLGAVAGPLMALGLLAVFAGNIRAVFWFAVIPAVIAVALLAIQVKEPEKKAETEKAARIRASDLGRMGAAFWWVLAIGGALTLARFSEAFLVLRAENVGLALGLVPLVLVVMSFVYALSAYPAGALFDRQGWPAALGLGLGFLIAANLFLALSSGVIGAFAGIALWGLHMGFSQGVLAAMVATAAPERLRASAFGLFNMVAGALLFLASLIAGVLWEALSPAAPFVAGAIFTGLSLLALLAGRAKIPVVTK